ncbi:F-box/kelch-repeat protein At3g06240-like [Neltuma alba]|uniref:F-box/kelch-repeat protein At3g06240-like n=1 Tax=Neltuma alba TaxID=207710 RepID=UPI0010A505A4|nr:F-box/kelch-repeat protein At3g06240-like [Prosopis alba]
MRNETPYLPQEIVRNILARLPVKSLIRFQYVCQDWKNLFKTPCFIAEHLHHSTQQNSLLVTDCYISKCIADTWHLSILNREMQFLEFRNPPIADTFGPLWRTIHSSNGLLCLDLIITNGPYNSFMLWNPAIREVRQVPHFINDFEKSDDASVGFGFSPVVNDYKIVKLSLLDRMVVEVEVYALRTAFWRKVKLGNLEVTTIKSDHGFPCNGSIFWYGLKEYDRIHVIVSFDIAIEVFTLIPFPTESLAFELSPFRLTMYDNKLALCNLCLSVPLVFLLCLFSSSDTTSSVRHFGLLFQWDGGGNWKGSVMRRRVDDGGLEKFA